MPEAGDGPRPPDHGSSGTRAVRDVDDQFATQDAVERQLARIRSVQPELATKFIPIFEGLSPGDVGRYKAHDPPRVSLQRLANSSAKVTTLSRTSKCESIDYGMLDPPHLAPPIVPTRTGQ